MDAGRNDLCPCGSGKKFKKCCLVAQDSRKVEDLAYRRLRAVETSLIPRLIQHAGEVFGPEAIEEAWDEFHCWQNDEGFSTESPLIPVFMPFYFYNWEIDPADTSCQDQSLVGKTVAESFLEANRRRLSKDEITILQASSRRVFSFYEIGAISSGQGFKVRNVLTGEQHDIVERTASEMLERGDIIFCALMTLNDTCQSLAMAPVPLPPSALLPLTEVRKHMQKSLKTKILSDKQVSEYNTDLREFYFAYVADLMDPDVPQMQNTDGDPLLPQTLNFEISSPDAAFAALKHLSTPIATEDELLADAVIKDGKLTEVEIPWFKTSKTKSKNLSNTVLGRIKISSRKMSVEVNSDKRAKAILKKIDAAMGSDARFIAKVIESVEGNIAKEDQSPASPLRIEDLPPEALSAVQAMADEHWKKWFTEKIPALNNMTPRQAAKSTEGRELLEALFNLYQRSSEDDAKAVNLFKPDVAKLRAKLGL